MFDDSFDILFDGFPRSGTTFGAQMLSISQENRIRVRFHRHLPPFLLAALRMKKPVCLTIRSPIDAVASWIVYTEDAIDCMLEKYIDFYTVLLPHRAELIVMPFDLVTQDFRMVILLINRRYGLDLRIPADMEACRQDAFRSIDNIWRDGSGKVNERQVARPCSGRDALNLEVIGKIKARRYAPLVRKCEELYAVFYEEFQAELNRYSSQTGQGFPREAGPQSMVAGGKK